MNTEIARVIRHVAAPVVAYAIGKGWIPAELQQPLIEAVLAGAAVVAALVASRARDRKPS